MCLGSVRVGFPVLLLTWGVTGLFAPRLSAGEKEQVEKAFQAFQAALKANDATKIYGLLDRASQAAADRAARFVRLAYARATAEQKARLVKTLGLPGTELARLTGKGFLKTKRFQGKYDEVPGSTIKEVTIKGNRATVVYIEPDLDKEKLILNRQKGQWKVSAPMPAIS